jgi:uncharacterized protein YrrD
MDMSARVYDSDRKDSEAKAAGEPREEMRREDRSRLYDRETTDLEGRPRVPGQENPAGQDDPGSHPGEARQRADSPGVQVHDAERAEREDRSGFSEHREREDRSGFSEHREREGRLGDDITGKSLISAHGGEKLGEVSNILIDPDTLRVSALVISQGNIFNREDLIFPADDVQVWGKDVILIKQSGAGRREQEIPDREKWLNVSDDIKGRYVVSMDGTRIGQVNDVVIGPDGRILGYDLSQVFVEGPLAESKRIPVDATHSLGKDVLIVNAYR